MEELRRAARASYEHLPEKDKKFIQKFFKDMDKSGDGHISLGEYVKYLEEKKATDLTHKSIFSALDMDGNGSLEIKEVIVLHYIMQSGRAMICMSCEKLMAGAYFSCSQCFFEDASVSTFDICCDCYGGKKFSHLHDGATFCDNYTLLRQSRSAIKEAPMKKRRKVIKILKKGLQIASITIGLGGLISIASGGDGKISDLFDDDDDDGADADGDADADADADGDGDGDADADGDDGDTS